MANNETPLRIVFVGHVDHGKSTLVGRLFNDTGSLPDGKLEQIQEVCKRRGVPFEWAFLMDALQAERDQNITIDTSQIWFRTETRPYVIIDAPGHREFLKNMITGAASADAAFLLIAANEGVQEQSRRHGYMLSLLGIRQVVVLVNKMDLVDYDQEKFDAIEAEYREFLGQIGLNPIRFVPISARDGKNIAESSPELGWFDGPSVVGALDAFKQPRFSTDLPLRFPIQDVYRFDERRILAGRIESGALAVGDELVFQPGDRTSTIASVERWSAPEGADADAGESVGITLTDQIFVERGHVATRRSTGAQVTNRFRANVFWMGRNPLKKSGTFKLKLATQEVECKVASFERVIDASTLEPVERTDALQKDDVAELILETKYPVSFDLHHDVEAMGRFVLVDGYDLSGGGIIIEALESAGVSEEQAIRAVSSDERFSQSGHLGLVVLLPDATFKDITAIDRALYDRGLRSFHFHTETLRDFTNVESIVSALAMTGTIVLANIDESLNQPTIETLLSKSEAHALSTSGTVADVVDEILESSRITWAAN